MHTNNLVHIMNIHTEYMNIHDEMNIQDSDTHENEKKYHKYTTR